MLISLPRENQSCMGTYLKPAEAWQAPWFRSGPASRPSCDDFYKALGATRYIPLLFTNLQYNELSP